MAEDGIESVEVDGVTIEVNVTYIQSWRGVKRAARIQAPDSDDSEKLGEILGYYEDVIANLPEVEAALPEDIPAADMLMLLARAVTEASPKN